jgi:hypothetical protein
VEESAFIEKTLHYIAGIRGAVKTDLTLSTNTSYPKRYVVVVRGLPNMTLSDFQSIRDMNTLIRSIKISMEDASVRIDIWRRDKYVRAVRKRCRAHDPIFTPVWDLSSVDPKDRPCLQKFLNRLTTMEGMDCQCNISIDTSEPELYTIDFQITDTLTFRALEMILHSCRTFCNDFQFNFPNKIFRAKCLRVAAPLKKRRHLHLKS